MNKYFKITIILLIAFTLNACEKDSVSLENIQDIGLKVSFSKNKSISTLKNLESLTYETPSNYYIALKSVLLLGAEGTQDVELFNEPDLASSFIFDYTDENTVHSLLKDATIPDGIYGGFEIEIYFLQMNIAIATADRGIERRNFRIYLSDDVETEDGAHQPGDITQINEGQEIGWLMGNSQGQNMDPISPRVAAYSIAGEGNEWLSFANKPGKDYGPFGDEEFMNTASHPIYKTKVGFNFNRGSGTEIILDFNVTDCWMFDDKSGDGVFGPADLDPVNPTEWNMELPEITVSLN
jgi:hypothetical protein